MESKCIVNNRLAARRLWRTSWLAYEPVRSESWLSSSERDVFGQLRDAGRRAAWLGARLLAKRLIISDLLAPAAAAHSIDPAEIEIHSRDGLGRPTRPRVIWRGRLQPWAMSITHADPWVLVAVSRVPGVAVGVDLAPLENWSHGCAEMWLTPWEHRQWHTTANRRMI